MRIAEANDDQGLYKVLINPEQQYSIWPADRANPAGWDDAGKSGSKADCLAYIRQVWTDARPKRPGEPTEIRLGVPTRDPEAGPDRGGGCPMGGG